MTTRARLVALLDALREPSHDKPVDAAPGVSARRARLLQALAGSGASPAPPAHRAPARRAAPTPTGTHAAPPLVGVSVEHAITAALLAQEGMSTAAWRKLAVDALTDLRQRDAERVAMIVEERLLTVDPVQGWLVEDAWLQALRAPSHTARTALVAARLYHDQEPIVRAAADVSERLDREARGLPPEGNDRLTEDDLGAFVGGNAPARRVLREALVALGIAEKAAHGALKIKRPSMYDREDAFGWLVTTELRAAGRSEASRAWVEGKSRAVRLLGCARHQAEALFFAAGAKGWWTPDVLVGQDRLLLPQDREAPSSTRVGAELLAAAAVADRTGHDAEELRRWVTAFREALRTFAFARFGDPTPVLKRISGYLFREWPRDPRLRHDAIRRSLEGVAHLADHGAKEGPDFLGLRANVTAALGAVARGFDEYLETAHAATEQAASPTATGDEEHALAAAVERLPPEVFARVVARMTEDMAEGTATSMPRWIADNAMAIVASADPAPGASRAEDAPGRILRFAAGLPVDGRADTPVAALQRLTLKAARANRPRAGRLAALLAGELGQVVQAQVLLLEIERPSPGCAGARAPRASQPEGLEVFAQRVVHAAEQLLEGRTGGTFGDHKAFISHVHRRAGGWSDLETFKTRLIEAHRAGLLTLSRADLVEAMTPTDVAESETTYLGEQFHFVRVDRKKPRW